MPAVEDRRVRGVGEGEGGEKGAGEKKQDQP